jgi:hypothetical protein
MAHECARESETHIHPARARALLYAGFLALLQGEFRKAASLTDEALVIARRMNLREIIASSLHVSGRAQMSVVEIWGVLLAE